MPFSYDSPALRELEELLQREGLCTTVRRGEQMAAHTTLRIGGPAQLFAVPRSIQAAADCINAARGLGVPLLVVGNGSNLLVSDEGIEGLVLSLKGLEKIERDGDRITAAAGVPLGTLAATARDHGLSGLEFAAGIPGTVGGGVLMNCGAYGGEMKDVVESSLVLDKKGNLSALKAKLHGFAYRHTALMGEGDIVLASTFRLTPADPAGITARMEDLARQRRDRQPLNLPSAGSTFKRPEGHFAAKLFDDCGLKGRSVGGAAVSDKHAGFIVNTGEATAADMLALMAQVQSVVLRETGVQLEPEVRFVGIPQSGSERDSQLG